MRINTYYKDESARVWLCFAFGNHFDANDWDIVECATHSLGKRPEWIDEELGFSGWDFILETYPEDFRPKWALAHGIAPCQPFLVELQPPRYSTDYYGESDVDFEWELIRIEPLDTRYAALRWDADIRVTALDKIEREARGTALRQKVESDTRYMVIRWDVYGSILDRGVYVEVISLYNENSPYRKNGYRPLVRADSREGNHDQAWAKLEEQVQRHLPALSLDKLRALPIHRRW